MNLQEVIKAFGEVSKATKNIPNGNKNNNGFQIIALLAFAGMGYLFYREWERRKKLEVDKKL